MFAGGVPLGTLGLGVADGFAAGLALVLFGGGVFKLSSCAARLSVDLILWSSAWSLRFSCADTLHFYGLHEDRTSIMLAMYI